MIRNMVCAGLFYPRQADDLQKNLEEFFTDSVEQTAQGGTFSKYMDREQKSVQICMLPHAGHIYSGKVTAQTLSEIVLPKKLIILCPNHRGLGTHGAIWEKGAFETPFGNVKIAEELAQKLLSSSYFTVDHIAHVQEHSIEVLLPFLYYQYGAEIKIVPISLMSLENITNMAEAIAQCMCEDSEVGLVISSDMNHFASEKENKHKDFLALNALRAMDEKKLLQTVIDHDISMCGVIGAIIGIKVAKLLGLKQCKLSAYDTSASVSGDTGRVVGYAGLYFI